MRLLFLGVFSSHLSFVLLPRLRWYDRMRHPQKDTQILLSCSSLEFVLVGRGAGANHLGPRVDNDTFLPTTLKPWVPRLLARVKRAEVLLCRGSGPINFKQR